MEWCSSGEISNGMGSQKQSGAIAQHGLFLEFAVERMTSRCVMPYLLNAPAARLKLAFRQRQGRRLLPSRVYKLDKEEQPSLEKREKSVRPVTEAEVENEVVPVGMNPKEWPVIKRVTDRLFPEGQMDWQEFFTRDDYEMWYASWRYFLEQEGLIPVVSKGK